MSRSYLRSLIATFAQCAALLGAACKSMIARLIRSHKISPSRSPRSSIWSALCAATISAFSPCCLMSRLAARQMSMSGVIVGCSGVVPLLHHLVGAGEQGRWHGYPERFGCPQVYDQLERRWLLHRQIGRFVAFEDPPGVKAEL